LSALVLTGSLASTASAQDFRRGDWNRDHDRRDNGRFERGRFDNQFNRNWRRGDRLPGGWQNRYRGIDYRAYHLRPAPYGYRYVLEDSGSILLVGLATGVILSAILSNY